MKIVRSRTLEDTAEAAKVWLSALDLKRDSALVVGLFGHLGAGKTAFVKVVAKELGIKEDVTSPTFVIMKIYDLQNENFRRLVHIDAYRLEKRAELEALSFESVVGDPGNLVMIEWPENVELGNDDVDTTIHFEIRDGFHLINI